MKMVSLNDKRQRDTTQVLSWHQINVFHWFDMNIFIILRSHKSSRHVLWLQVMVTWLHLEAIQLFLLIVQHNKHFINCHCSKTRITSVSIHVIVISDKKFRCFHSWKFYHKRFSAVLLQKSIWYFISCIWINVFSPYILSITKTIKYTLINFKMLGFNSYPHY